MYTKTCPSKQILNHVLGKIKKNWIEARKHAEEILKLIETYNKVAQEVMSLQKIISRNMKDAITNAESLDNQPLPLPVRIKMEQYKEKYTTFEKIGLITGQVKRCDFDDESIS